MPKDGLRRLPDHIVGPLLRTLMCIPRRRGRAVDSARPEDPRPPVALSEGNADFNVVWRNQVVGRIWRHDYSRDTTGDMARYPWHWERRNVEGRGTQSGHAPTLESAMADFRRAWDGNKAMSV
jgi:hypothetical protein